MLTAAGASVIIAAVVSCLYGMLCLIVETCNVWYECSMLFYQVCIRSGTYVRLCHRLGSLAGCRNSYP